MSKRALLLIVTSVVMCGLLLAAVLVPLDRAESSGNAVLTREPMPTPSDMVWIPGGSFVMGEQPLASPENPLRVKEAELPAHEVVLDGFWMDDAPVTNAEFEEFVNMTGYVTLAERDLTKEDFAARGTDISAFPDGTINAGSMCFNPNFDRQQLVMSGPGWENQVWQIVEGADWRRPDGPDSSIEGREDHPVVHVAWEDAVAYCDWAGKRLATEAEFEYASRSGGKDVTFPWGNEFIPDGQYMANYWQGVFPIDKRNEDGFTVTSPVKSFPPNEIGLYDMAGNVWEWCHDLYHENYYEFSPRRNPQGPDECFDPLYPGMVTRVQRGGSFLCNTNNCTGYRTRARGHGDVASSSYHTGFRGVVDGNMVESYQAAQQKIAAWRASGSPVHAAVTQK